MPGPLLAANEEEPRDSLKPQNSLWLIAPADIVYERDVLGPDAQHSPKPWLEYLGFKRRNGSLLDQVFVLERAVTALPRSYKLWKTYLQLRIGQLQAKNPAKYAGQFAKVNGLFERALVLLNKMPRIWIMYLEFLLLQPLQITTRRVFDRALRSLPPAQHNRIWALYRPWARAATGAAAVEIWRRYVQAKPEDAEDYIDILVAHRRYTEAVQEYMKIVDNPAFKSKQAKGHFQFWTDMIELIIDHAREIRTGDETGIDVDKIIQSGIRRFQDQRGILWVGLARYWINIGRHEKARDTFEEGILSVNTVRDFTIIFDTYAEAEEAILGVLLEQADARAGKGIVNDAADADLEIRMDRMEQLMNRRPFLLSHVILRQNPNNVNEWMKRVALWGDDKAAVLQTYLEAIDAINPRKAVGQFHELWIHYARVYEDGDDLESCRLIFEKAVKVPFKSVAELAEMWCAWAEMELRQEEFDRAVAVMQKATQAPKRSRVDYFDETLSPQQRVHKSWKLWSFYVDLVESVSSLDETRLIYERIFELRIATPQTVVNYANLLEEHGYFEDSYKVYERGLDLFSYPVAFELWNLYLSKATARQVSIERLRDLFEQAVDGCPATFAKPLYLMYGALEEERGLARHAMRIYERATRAVSDGDRAEMFNFYITKSASNFGLTSTRSIYERAIAALPDVEAKEMCIKFAEMERRLGEIDRARAIYGHASQFCDPRVEPGFWAKWESFEVQHGNEDTFKEMLRIKRSVQAQFNTDVSFVASQAVARSGAAGASLQRDANAPVGFVAASTTNSTAKESAADESTLKEPAPAAVANPNAIDLDLDDDDDDDENEKNGDE